MWVINNLDAFFFIVDINNLRYSHTTYICSLFKTEQKRYLIQTPFTDYTCSMCSLEEVHFQAFAQLPYMKSTMQVMKRNCSIDFWACKQALFRAVRSLPVFCIDIWDCFALKLLVSGFWLVGWCCVNCTRARHSQVADMILPPFTVKEVRPSLPVFLDIMAQISFFGIYQV